MSKKDKILGALKTATAGVALMTLGVGLATVALPMAASAQDHGGKKGDKGRGSGESTDKGSGRSMEDIYRDIGAAEEDSDRPTWAGVGRRASGDATGGETEEDSDRPAWAGTKGGKNDRGTKPGDAGSTRGDLYGDMYVILRDANGVPILNAAGFVQPIDEQGHLIPLDAEGAPIDATLVQEVEMGRLNVGRSPTSVLDKRASEVVALLNTATAISIDPAGRLVITGSDGTKTIDAPLENLALYVALMTQGTIPGVTDLPGTEFDYLVDGKLTAQDMVIAASLIAGAADKAASLSPDAVAYMNAILGIDTKTVGSVTWSDVDYSTYSYDRSTTYGSVTTTVLVKQPNGSYLPTEVNIYDAVFASKDYSGTGTFTAFATAADDARAVINYIHEYAIPADTVAAPSN